MADGYDSHVEEATTDSQESTSTHIDPLDDFLERYTFRYNPEYCIKLRSRYVHAMCQWMSDLVLLMHM